MAQEPEEEKTYEVRDKRRVSAEGTLREDTGPQAEERPEGSQQAEDQEMPPPDVYAILGFTSSMLAETAWQLLGIRLAPGQKELAKDLPQAKVAIDTLVFISDKLQPHISEEERKYLRAIVSDLQMNYVRISQEAG